MRRKDREITDINEIFDILRRCDTVRIGMQGDRYPYVVPVSFGMEVKDGKAIVYFHCAKQGLKLDYLEKNNKVCIEGDIFIKTEPTDHGITTRYESVIGFGEFSLVTDMDEMILGLKLLTEHYGFFDYPFDRCRGIDHLKVGKITVDEITGKRNLPGTLTPANIAALNRDR